MRFFRSSSKADGVVSYTEQQHQDLIREHGYPIYVLFVDLRWSVGGGFSPQLAHALENSAARWGTAGTTMQHWAIMVDDHVYELARKLDGTGVADPGMNNNPNFSRPTAIPKDMWQEQRQMRNITWRKYYYTRKEKAEIITIGMNLPMFHSLALLLPSACQPKT
ncbi:hypothetical protein IQ07DRAFT_663845 [Pyrenochaeta sp. DS3sAY3a]|nr:hypothetical protein IQ07DRAFT_663845 [Pyrenochaeta sp. DS3sAY3a]